ncbi:uncharacterized protein LOC114522893 [Dendronephthya gigantea]|uniref:uncharacterized protein LOC114522893 n=1 Tax=Dendronephthya gigantea TaxID=151771 RepID=UPI001069DF7D|nr:uncharacterized protein LOC114522893 [Dendronephthya gigantea]
MRQCAGIIMNIYTEGELRYFRLAKGVIGYSTAALRKAFRREWNRLYPSKPWRDDGTSGRKMLAEEQLSRHSRLYDPKFAKECQSIKDHLKRGDVEEWDVTTLVFAFLYSHALNGIRYRSHWGTVNTAIHKIKQVRNRVFAHACEASISRTSFMRNFGILEQGVQDLLHTRSDPLVKDLRLLRTETEFVTDDLVKYKKLLQEDHNSLLLIDENLKTLERKMNISEPKGGKNYAIACPGTFENSEIISSVSHRINRLEHELSSPVDLVPSCFKPSIFHSSRYIKLMNGSNSMSYNFCWDELSMFLKGFDDNLDIKMFAAIQSAVSLSHQSRKDESFDALNSLTAKDLLGTQYGLALFARVKIRKAYILHDRGKDDEAIKEVHEAELMLSNGDYHEDRAEINCAKANIYLSSGKNSAGDRENILLHLDKCIHFCEISTVDKSVTITQVKLRKALCHLGYYQHGIIVEAPKISEVNIAETILSRISKESDLSKRSQVYQKFAESLLAYRKGKTSTAIELEEKLRRKCERHEIRFEIKQLDMLKALIRGSE